MLKSVAFCSIHIIGDWGRRGQFFQVPVAEKMRTINHSAVISTGDNFYPEGITDTKDPQIYESWSAIYKPDQPWYIALGNHDHRGNASAQTFIDLPYWIMPAPVYSTTICNNTFVFMDSTSVSGEQWKHVEHLLSEGSPNKWIVAHHPIYSGGWHYLVNDDYRDKMTELYKKFDVRAIISGHDHNLQYIEWGDVRQIVSGAGSSTYGGRSPQEGVTFFSEEAGFVQFEVNQQATTIKYIGLDQTLFETEIKTI
jgi:predicted phosphodiesterase